MWNPMLKKQIEQCKLTTTDDPGGVVISGGKMRTTTMPKRNRSAQLCTKVGVCRKGAEKALWSVKAKTVNADGAAELAVETEIINNEMEKVVDTELMNLSTRRRK